MPRGAQHIIDLAYSMKPGEALRIHGPMFEEAFPVTEFSEFFGHGSSIDQFLEKMMGSTYGTWRCQKDIKGDWVYVITCHAPDPDHKVYHVSPDRRWMFNRLPDGTYERWT